MIISKSVQIKISKGNIPYFKNKGYNIKIGDILDVLIVDLSKGSNIKVEAVCDICGLSKEISYKLYNRSLLSGGQFACSKKCSSKKLSNILLDKYGVLNVSQISYVKEKIKETNNKNWGSDSFFSSEVGRDRIKKSIVDKYGVDNPQKSELIKEKTKETNRKKYGVDYTLQSEEIRKSINKTNIEKYGYITPSKSDLVKEKIKSTNQKRYSGNSPMCSPNTKEKLKKTFIEKYGIDSPLKMISIDENHRKRYKLCCDENYIGYMGNGFSLFKCEMGHNYEILSDNYISRLKLNVPKCTICFPIGDQKSIKEKELLSFITSIYSGQIIESHRDKYEIDIYLPDLKLGFEFNGLYWHSELYKEKNYHSNKTNFFKEREIRIFHIWEDDWVYKKEIIISMIRNLININTNRVFARNCYVVEINDNSYKDFLEKNHIQGYVRSKVKIGLIFNNEIVSIMTFDQFEGRNKMSVDEWNLSRFCSLLNTSVVGGASKLLSYFIKKYAPKRIISYADKDWSNGELYYKLGFIKVFDSKTDYKYVIGDKRYHKSKFRKSNLNTSLSESAYMSEKKFFKIWDCGKIKFEMIPQIVCNS